MEKFVQYAPTEIIFGKETELEIGNLVEKYKGSKVLLVYGGGSIIKTGLLQKVKDILAQKEIYFEELRGVKPNPRLTLAREGVLKARNMNADFILAIGGGSAIDTAKAIALACPNPQYDLWEDIWMKQVALEVALPVGVILTLAAAGSETSDSAVLTNEELCKKAGKSISWNRPKFAIMNPELTYSIPKKQLTCGIVDIMMHTMDRYFTSLQGNELTDQIAESVLRVTIENGTKAFKNIQDYKAMSEIMWAGSVSHNGITGLGGIPDFATHGIGHGLSAKYDTYHGESLSVIWPAWARYVYTTDKERFARYAKNVWGIKKGTLDERCIAGIEATEQYFSSIHMPISFSELECGIRGEEELRDLAKIATKNDSVTVGSFVRLNEEDIFNIYKEANK